MRSDASDGSDVSRCKMYSERFDRIPPWLCRLLARTHHGHRLMTEREICERSGLNRERVVQISRLRTWRTVPLGVIEQFSGACGVNLLTPKEHLRFLRRRRRIYLVRATAGQRRMLARLMAMQSARGPGNA